MGETEAETDRETETETETEAEGKLKKNIDLKNMFKSSGFICPELQDAASTLQWLSVLCARVIKACVSGAQND